jgi:RsiW-degrading membrane proteinase PrsW (M82 family)
VVLVPLGVQLLMLAGAIILYIARSYFDEALDGMTFGAAGALGFTFAQNLVNLSPELSYGVSAVTPTLFTVLEVVQRGVLAPLLAASATGLIAGALWLARGRSRPEEAQALTSLPVAAVMAAVADVLFVALAFAIRDQLYVVLLQAALVVGMLFVTRLAIHHLLLSEAVEVAIGPPMPCSNCHRVVPRMAFCPHCGIATRATPKTGDGRSGRVVR